MRTPLPYLRSCFVLAALVSVLCGCSSFRIFNKDDSEERAEQIDAVQLRVMQFADEYVGQIIGPLNTLQAQTLDPRQRLDAQNWKVSQATAAYTNATQQNPVTGTLDMIVLAVLSHMVVTEETASPSGRLRSAELRDAHRKLEMRSWELSTEVLDDQQRDTIRTAIEKWRAANPNVRAVSLVHYGDLARTLIPAEKQGFMSKGLLGMIGIEPLRGLDPAVREIAQTRQLAQRSIYYIQRAPGLLDMQVERLTYQLAVMPESRLLLQDANRIADAAQRAGLLAESLPAVIAQERDATITQISANLNSQQGKARALARELRELLDAGAVTSDSLNTTIKSLDGLVARFKPPAQASGAAQAKPSGDKAKRSAVSEYTDVFRELARTTEELQELIVTLEQSTGGVERLSASAVASGKSVVDYLILRIILLVSAIALIVVVSVIVCRVVWQLVKVPQRHNRADPAER